MNERLREQCIEAGVNAVSYEVRSEDRADIEQIVDAILPLVRESEPQYEQVGWINKRGCYTFTPSKPSYGEWEPVFREVSDR